VEILHREKHVKVSDGALWTERSVRLVIRRRGSSCEATVFIENMGVAVES